MFPDNFPSIPLREPSLKETTVLLADIADFAAMNEIYAEFFAPAEGETAAFPARSAFAVKDLPKGALVEIELIAAKG